MGTALLAGRGRAAIVIIPVLNTRSGQGAAPGSHWRGHRAWRGRSAGAGGGALPLLRDQCRHAEGLDTVEERVRHVDGLAFGRHCDGSGTEELALVGASTAPLAQVGAVGIKVLDAVIGGVPDIDRPVGRDRQRGRPKELSLATAFAAPLAEQRPGSVKD